MKATPMRTTVLDNSTNQQPQYSNSTNQSFGTNQSQYAGNYTAQVPTQPTYTPSQPQYNVSQPPVFNVRQSFSPYNTITTTQPMSLDSTLKKSHLYSSVPDLSNLSHPVKEVIITNSRLNYYFLYFILIQL